MKDVYQNHIARIAPSLDTVIETTQAIVSAHVRLNGRLKTKTAIELHRWLNHKTKSKVMPLHELQEMEASMFDPFSNEKAFDDLHKMLGSVTFETYMFVRYYIRVEIDQTLNISLES